MRGITLDDLGPCSCRARGLEPGRCPRCQVVAQTGGHPELGEAGRRVWEKMHPGTRECAAPTTGGRPSARGSGGRRTVVDGIAFPSRVEARVWSALVAVYGRDRVRRPRALNLWAPAPDARAVPGEFRPDFAVLGPGLPARVAFWVDAKAGKWRSPEWRRGVADFRASYPEPIYEWDGKGECPCR